MRKGATTAVIKDWYRAKIVALRNEKGSYNLLQARAQLLLIVALRNEKGSYNQAMFHTVSYCIVALRNEKGSYN